MRTRIYAAPAVKGLISRRMAAVTSLSDAGNGRRIKEDNRMCTELLLQRLQQYGVNNATVTLLLELHHVSYMY